MPSIIWVSFSLMNWTTKNCFGKTFASSIQLQIDRFRCEAFSEHFENFQWKTIRQITAIRTMNLRTMWTMWWAEQMVCIWLASVCKKHRNNKKWLKYLRWNSLKKNRKKKNISSALMYIKRVFYWNRNHFDGIELHAVKHRFPNEWNKLKSTTDPLWKWRLTH